MAKLPVSAGNTISSDGDRKFDPIPENRLVDVVVENCEIREYAEEFRKQYNVKDTHEVSFKFRVQGGEFDNRVLWGSAKPYFEGDGSRLRLWTKEILGLDNFPADYEFDTDHLIGLPARVLVTNYKKRDGTVGDKVKDVLRAVNTVSEVDDSF
ncbi:MAG: hypothetical protein EBU08_00335 [Micrococcales bacterium]|nr:hypothetical protein [Micrococcales bacterium]